jgi:hypothetical protein
MSSKNKTFELAQLVLLLAGVITLTTGFFLPPGLREGLKGILHSLGTAFLAGSMPCGAVPSRHFSPFIWSENGVNPVMSADSAYI